jgi:phosphocarrier protein HPr
MLRKTLTIVNKLGLHARAATKLVRLASAFESDIQLKRQQREVNGKSIMGVMLLAASKGTEIELIISGADETTALAELAALIENGFGEEQ